MARAHLRGIVRVGPNGRPVENAAVLVTAVGTSDPPLGNVYAARTGGDPLVEPIIAITNDQGEYELWSDTPQTVTLQSSDNDAVAHFVGAPAPLIEFEAFDEVGEFFAAPEDVFLNDYLTKAAIDALGVDSATLEGMTATDLQDTITAAIVDAAPGTLNTLNELAAALGDDADFAATVMAAIGARVLQTDFDTLEGRVDDIEQAITLLDLGIFSARAFGAVGDNATDDTAALQAMLTAARLAGGGLAFVEDGTYLITTELRIGGNTKLQLAPNATIKRNAAIEYMLRSYGSADTDDPPGVGYTGPSNVEVFGGTWDGNKDAFPSNVNIITPTHGAYWGIYDMTVKNCHGWHFVELHAMQHVVVRNVDFQDFDAATASKEMVQLDVGSDGTPCDDILIQGCTFTNGSRGVGSHNIAGHTRVRIVGCNFDTMRDSGIRVYSSSHVTVSGCTFTNCIIGIHVIAEGVTTRRNITVIGNVINGPTAGAATAGIYIDGGTTTRRIAEATVMGNTVRGGAATGYIGIYALLAQNIQITGNVVANCTADGIKLHRCVRAQVNSNQSRDNATTGTAGTSDITISGAAATDAQDILVLGNGCKKLYLGPFGDRFVITNNIIDTSYTVSGVNAPTNIQKLNNYIAGVWTP